MGQNDRGHPPPPKAPRGAARDKPACQGGQQEPEVRASEVRASEPQERQEGQKKYRIQEAEERRRKEKCVP